MITPKNMERGLELLDLFKNNFQKFEEEINKLSKKDKEQIGWWYEKCFSKLRNHKTLDEFMN